MSTYVIYNIIYIIYLFLDKKEALLSEDIPKYNCPICKKLFSNIFDFQSHKIDEHGMKERKSILKKICPLCQYEGVSKSELINHFESIHNLSIMSETKSFSSFDEFIAWKTNEEKTTNMIYRNKLKNQFDFNSRKQIIYRCHRSGHFQPSGKGIRRLKSQGTNKINGYCPAEMSLKICDQNKCEVLWIKSHVGHEGELTHLRLSATERSKIASKIEAKIPFSAILEEIKNSVSNCNLERIHLLTKRDLRNIAQSNKNKNLINNLDDDSVRDHDNSLSLDSWVAEMTNSFDEPKDSIKEEQSSLTKAISNNEEGEKTLQVHKEELQAFITEVIANIDTLGQFEMISKMITPSKLALYAMKNRFDEKSIIQPLITEGAAGSSASKEIEPQGLCKIKKRKSK